MSHLWQSLHQPPPWLPLFQEAVRRHSQPSPHPQIPQGRNGSCFQTQNPSSALATYQRQSTCIQHLSPSVGAPEYMSPRHDSASCPMYWQVLHPDWGVLPTHPPQAPVWHRHHSSAHSGEAVPMPSQPPRSACHSVPWHNPLPTASRRASFPSMAIGTEGRRLPESALSPLERHQYP